MHPRVLHNSSSIDPARHEQLDERSSPRVSTRCLASLVFVLHVISQHAETDEALARISDAVVVKNASPYSISTGPFLYLQFVLFPTPGGSARHVHAA